MGARNVASPTPPAKPRPGSSHVDPSQEFGYGDVVDTRIEQALRDALANGPASHFVAVFGSRATGTARADSDIDLAWLPADPNIPLSEELALQAELTRVAGGEVDLVRLDRASTICRHEVARDGQLLTGSPASFARFRAEAVGEYLDFEPALREATERFRRRLAAGGKAGTP